VSDMVGCGDNSCVFRVLRKSGGMGTNGGCRCFKNLEMRGRDNGIDYSNHDSVRRVEQDTQRLAGELRRTKEQRDELLAALEVSVSTIEQLVPSGMHRGVIDVVLAGARAAIAKAKGGTP